MNKKVLVVVVIVLSILAISAAVFAYNINQNKQNDTEKMASSNSSAGDSMPINETKANDDAMNNSGSYITLATYNAESAKYADSIKIYFFHASWCSICQSIDKELSSDSNKIPAGVTLIKTDFDSSKELRKKYGVTTQYTFVQVDSEGNETAQWSATSSSAAIDGIKM